MNENWIFTYESIKKGWLVPVKNPIDDNEYFKILLANGVYFYNEAAKVKTYTIKKPKVEKETASKESKNETAKKIVFSGGGGGSSY